MAGLFDHTENLMPGSELRALDPQFGVRTAQRRAPYAQQYFASDRSRPLDAADADSLVAMKHGCVHVFPLNL
jgi:hypothetical protein